MPPEHDFAPTSKPAVFVLTGCYLLVVLGPALLAFVLQPEGGHSFAAELGRTAALIAFPVLLMQPVLAARLRRIERSIGLDLLMGFHKAMAVMALGFLLSHPLLLAGGGEGWGLLYSIDVKWFIWLGRVAGILLVVAVVVALTRRRIGLSFETWRLSHNVLVLSILALGFTHSLFAGHDFKHPLMVWLWAALLLLALTSYIFLRSPARLHPHRFLYRIVGVSKETPSVTTLKLAPPAGESCFGYAPGQFLFLTLKRGRDLPQEEHPFTISSSPAQVDRLSVTIKDIGDFTATVAETRVGDEALVEGPFGRFTYLSSSSTRAMVFIAGGIGITPLMSMLRHMRDTNSAANVILLHFARIESDLVFGNELLQMQAGAAPCLTYVPVLTRPDSNWEGEQGRPSAGLIDEHCRQDRVDKDYYVCGPPAMIQIVLRILMKAGIPRNHIHFERFEL